ncbi:Uncharacterized conserved protein [Plasmopara halstedii]|uniref:Uncharacterized conserved protein n=1 Tax=Plasmopara halstedii TaxID=4781 RepID=A0A0P1ARH3_PLAHL|nr:Uncharacterized conserved protein [Plasmopara halstedii]CEG43977.1 Uncharacterized conserved protein [Plasmopara halstedii]|eukprot:XP_024580346.1 Uncharacterized conserved protein [Plasmopara halstedii]
MGVSDEMLALYEAQRRAHETVLTLQAQIEEEEAVYLEETPHGNIIRGWDGFIDSKQSRKDTNPKKVKPYTEAEHLFSNSCFYASLADEPSFDQVDISKMNNEEGSGRRKLTVTLSVGKGADSVSGVVDSGTALSTQASYKEPSVLSIQRSAKAAPYFGAEASNYQTSSVKKRKKEMEGTIAKTIETTSTNSPLTATLVMTGTAPAPPPASDFLDVL